MWIPLALNGDENWFHHQSMKFKLAHKKEGSSEVGTDQSGILKIIILNFELSVIGAHGRNSFADRLSNLW